jgi:hypothetical protein
VLEPCEFTTVTLPLTVSELVGLNVSVIAAFCPTPSVTGVAMPVVVTSLAFIDICEIVTLLLPTLVSVTLCELELPALMLPKLTLAGLADMLTVAATPVPLSETVAGEFGALLAKPMEPFNVPTLVGANVALNEVLFPAATFAGVANPLTL